MKYKQEILKAKQDIRGYADCNRKKDKKLARKLVRKRLKEQLRKEELKNG